MKLTLIGCGTVGIKFLELIRDKEQDLKDRYNLEISIVGAVDSSGAAINENGLDIDTLIDTKVNHGKISLYPNDGHENKTGLDVINEVESDVVLEAGVSDVKTGGIALENAKAAIKKKNDVVFLNKGPLVAALNELNELSAENGVSLKLSGATAAALPTIDVAVDSLAGTTIHSVEGIFNGTTNFILGKMTNENESYDAALKEAQSIGIAETDPRNDVEGYDTATKILILANTVMGGNLTLNDVEINGITNITIDDIKKAQANSKVIKLLGKAVNDNGDIKVNIDVYELDENHPLANVENEVKGIHFVTDTMGELTVIGGKSDPRAAAAAALKDVILLRKGKTWQ